MNQASPSGKTMLDGPPPLPKEASRKASKPSSSWMNQPKSDDLGLGSLGNNPLLKTLSAHKQIEGNLQILAGMYPAQSAQYAALVAALGQTIAQSLASTTSPAGVGAPPSGPPMAAPPPPPGPMGGAGPQAGPPGPMAQ